MASLQDCPRNAAFPRRVPLFFFPSSHPSERPSSPVPIYSNTARSKVANDLINLITDLNLLLCLHRLPVPVPIRRRSDLLPHSVSLRRLSVRDLERDAEEGLGSRSVSADEGDGSGLGERARQLGLRGRKGKAEEIEGKTDSLAIPVPEQIDMEAYRGEGDGEIVEIQEGLNKVDRDEVLSKENDATRERSQLALFLFPSRSRKSKLEGPTSLVIFNLLLLSFTFTQAFLAVPFKAQLSSSTSSSRSSASS